SRPGRTPPKSVPSAPTSGAFFATLDTRDDTAQTEVGMSRTAAELPRLASPDSIAELSELMARAHAESRTVTVFGGGTAFDDHPPAATPGLAARSGQEVRADLPDERIAAGASLGGMIATAAAGPRHLHRPRLAETVVSMTSVGADGTIARTADGLSPALAGRELPRLLTGSWGTRAIIVAAEIELSMRPAAQQFVWIPGAEAAAALLGAR